MHACVQQIQLRLMMYGQRATVKGWTSGDNHGTKTMPLSGGGKKHEMTDRQNPFQFHLGIPKMLVPNNHGFSN